MFSNLMLALIRIINAKAAYYEALAEGIEVVPVIHTIDSDSTSSEGRATTMGAGGPGPVKSK